MNKKKIYLGRIKTVGKYTVWKVNGEYIRKNLNENFVIYDDGNHLSFIPRREFWIEKDSNPEEWNFFIINLIAKNWALESGLSPKRAEKAGIRAEKRERAKMFRIKNTGKTELSKEKILKKIYKKLLKTQSKKISVWLVDGKAVRDLLSPDYKAGGHDKIYRFIPKKEIWIEKTLPKKEQEFILLHELHERFLMAEGKNYPRAHMGATIVEDHFRNHPKGLQSRIAKETERQ